ncbi:ribosome alternative rescue factor ArfA [Pseudomonas berkeleyensis]|jgi:alternative ribosome-rescue factor|uniref:Ribosome alternative rescue factor ArfA n=1 Tax=Pseudomonas berkeleyensis TaxID=2726956 RepID=A0A7G5DLA1_9PSED|nr:ribosome alternative rescue factor ArfA [Pseudomonas berkeleyensis]
MSKKAAKRPNKAKSIVAQPLFRSRQERPQKGKGSYRREASHNWEASCFMGHVNTLIALSTARAC